MQIPEHDLILELTRAAMSGSACVYLFYAMDNLLMARSMPHERRGAAFERSLFALFSGLFCVVELSMTFMYGGPLAAYFNPLLYAVGTTATVMYARTLRTCMAGGALVHWLVVVLGSSAVCLALLSFVLFFVTDAPPSMAVIPIESGNAILFALTGGSRVEPDHLTAAVLGLGSASQFILLGSMWVGRIRRRFTDPIILLGVTLSSVCILVELGLLLLLPTHIVLVVFAANLPEVVRVSILERRRHSAFLVEQAEAARAEAEAARARAEERAIELAQVNKELQDSQSHLVQAGKLAALGLLVSGIAHELNNPLQLISANAEILEHRLKGSVASEDRAFVSKGLARIVKGAERCGRIINGLLRFARQSDHQLASLDLRSVVNATLEFTELQLRRRGAEVRVDLPGQALQVQGDSTQLSQVLVTLLLNAADAMEEGGEIVVTAVRQQDTVLLSVQDEGMGIPAEALPHIFDPFFTTKRPGRGTGLGLSVSHSIVEGHGGRLDVESEEGKGSTFTVCLPVMAS